MEYFVAFLTAAVVTALFTPGVIRVSAKLRGIDIADERRIHKDPTPRLGGLAVGAGLAAALGVAMLLIGTRAVPDHGISPLPLGLACLVMLATGFVDDTQRLSATVKLVIQTLVASAAVASGIRIDAIGLVVGSDSFALGWAAAPLTVFWIVLVTNAFNLIDGLDGLAAGVGIIATTTLAYLAASNNAFAPALALVAIAGGLSGFLLFNHHPARIFLGDSGTLLVGFLLGVLSIPAASVAGKGFFPVFPLLILALPLIDTAIAVLRRSIDAYLGRNNGDPLVAALIRAIMRPDLNHIHHRVLKLGMTYRNAVRFLCAVSALFAAAALLLPLGESLGLSVTVSALSLTSVVAIRRLGYDELSLRRNGMLTRVLRLVVINRRWVILVGDAVSAAICLVGALIVSEVEAPNLVVPVILVVALQIAIYRFNGIYRINLKTIGVGDALRITRAVAIGAFAGFAVLTASGAGTMPSRVLAGTLDFFFLAASIFLKRMSFRMSFPTKPFAAPSRRKALIHGTGTMGVATMRLLVHSRGHDLLPVGFLDEDPMMEGKTLHGLTVFGGHYKVRRLIQKLGVSDIIIADQDLQPEVRKRLLRLGTDHGVRVRTVRLKSGAVTLSTAAPPARAPVRTAPIIESRMAQAGS